MQIFVKRKNMRHIKIGIFALIAERKEKEENAVQNAITRFAEFVNRFNIRPFVGFKNITITIATNFASPAGK